MSVVILSSIKAIYKWPHSSYTCTTFCQYIMSHSCTVEVQCNYWFQHAMGTNNAIRLGPQTRGSCIGHMGHRQWQGYAKGLNDFALKGLGTFQTMWLTCNFFSLIVHGPPLTKHDDEEDHLSEALTEGSEAGALLLLLGKMLFLTHSAKGNPLGGLYIPVW